MSTSLTFVVLFCFVLSISAIIYTYLLYPILLKLITQKKSWKHTIATYSDQLPSIAILLSARNEEQIIEQKIDSIYNTSYPLHKLFVYIGSDNSDDSTQDILIRLQKKYASLHVTIHNTRKGKPAVLNELIMQIDPVCSVLVFTDANVLFSKFMLEKLCRHFVDESIGMVGANVINAFDKTKDIARQESYYIQHENRVKYQEGLWNGSMIGAFGACYAIQRNLFISFPPNIIVDDFYLSMHILSQKKKAILDPDALCTEDLPGEIMEEFRRKKRISAGNYQNMKRFVHMLSPQYKQVAFCFFSHKIVRWSTPFLLLFSFFCFAFLCYANVVPLGLFIVLCLFVLSIICIDIILEKMNIQIVPLRYIRYFIYMNWALLSGFFVYIKGIESNVWTPTKRENR